MEMDLEDITMEEKRPKYCIVLFDDGFQLVPQKWLNVTNTMCWWPNYKNSKRSNQAVQFMEEVGENWTQCPVIGVVGRCDSFERGKKKLEEAECYSELISNSDGEGSKANRSRIKKRIYYEVSSDDSSGSEIKSTLKSLKKKRPKIPNFLKHNGLEAITPENKQSCACNTPTVRIEHKRKSPTESEGFKVGTALASLTASVNMLKHQMNALTQGQKELKDLLKHMENKIVVSVCNSQMPGEENIKVEVIDPQEIERDFPLMSLDQFNEMETKLESRSYKNLLIKHFSKIGGREVTHCTRYLMPALLSDDVAKLFSWAGFKKKIAFQNMKLASLIFEIVRVNFPTATNETISQAVQAWLVRAKVRCEAKKAKSTDAAVEEILP